MENRNHPAMLLGYQVGQAMRRRQKPKVVFNPTAFLYDDGSLVFQSRATPDSAKTVLESYKGWDTASYTVSLIDSSTLPPWYRKRSAIKSAVIDDDVAINDTSYFFYPGSNLEFAKVGKMVDRIGKAMFYSCNSLEVVELPDGINSIGDSAFYECVNLSDITLPDGVSTIGYMAFQDCHKLSKIILPHSVTTLKEQACATCLNLSKAVILGRIQTLEKNTFIRCGSLKTIALPSTITSIHNYACGESTSDPASFRPPTGYLNTVYFEGTQEQWNAIQIVDDSGAVVATGGSNIEHFKNATIHYNYDIGTLV